MQGRSNHIEIFVKTINEVDIVYFKHNVTISFGFNVVLRHSPFILKGPSKELPSKSTFNAVLNLFISVESSELMF